MKALLFLMTISTLTFASTKSDIRDLQERVATLEEIISSTTIYDFKKAIVDKETKRYTISNNCSEIKESYPIGYTGESNFIVTKVLKTIECGDKVFVMAVGAFEKSPSESNSFLLPEDSLFPL